MPFRAYYACTHTSIHTQDPPPPPIIMPIHPHTHSTHLPSSSQTSKQQVGYSNGVQRNSFDTLYGSSGAITIAVEATRDKAR